MKQIKTIDHILVVKLDHAGDVLWTTPVLTALKQHYPASRLSVLCTPYTQAVLSNNPAIDDLIPVIDSTYPDNLPRPDLALCLDTRTPAVRLTYRSHARIRSGYYYFPRGLSVLWPLLLLTDPVLHPASRGDFSHEVMVNLQLLARHGCKITQSIPSRLYLLENELQTAKELLAAKGFCGERLIAVHLPLKWLNGAWPPEHLTELLHRLAQRWPQAKLLISCGPGEESLLNQISANLPAQSLCFTNQSFRVWAALLQNADILICRDCGPVHVAAALNIPVISIFEESKRLEHTRWEPWLVPHRNIFRPDNWTLSANADFQTSLLSAVADLLD